MNRVKWCVEKRAHIWRMRGVTYLLGCLDKLRKNVKTMLPAVSKSAEVIEENGIEILSGPKSAQAYQNRRDRQV